MDVEWRKKRLAGFSFEVLPEQTIQITQSLLVLHAREDIMMISPLMNSMGHWFSRKSP
jgi:hypothetical protein